MPLPTLCSAMLSPGFAIARLSTNLLVRRIPAPKRLKKPEGNKVYSVPKGIPRPVAFRKAFVVESVLARSLLPGIYRKKNTDTYWKILQAVQGQHRPLKALARYLKKAISHGTEVGSKSSHDA